MQPSFIPYLSINNHGTVGDRRTAALVAADGTVDWLCLPDYDSPPVFGALLDAARGSYWRLGPSPLAIGRQSYREQSASLVTTWASDSGELELTDVMVWPQKDRAQADAARRVFVRHLRCTFGAANCAMRIVPRLDFNASATVERTHGGLRCDLGNHTLGLWTSLPMQITTNGAEAAFSLRHGEEIWAVLAWDEPPDEWSVEAARRASAETLRYWQQWQARLTYAGPRSKRIEHSALIIHLLGYAPTAALVAAPTTSLPEQIGGEHNYDYRYTWVRDASLSVAGLSLLGDNETAARYLGWLATLKSSDGTPLQVAYRVSGATDLHQHDRYDIAGYRGSRPVRIGNRAFDQIQLGSFGYLADCTLIHIDQGGKWQPEYWPMIQRIADWVAEHWSEPDSGIWELPTKEHFTSSKVMSWVVLDRAVKLAEHAGHSHYAAAHWQHQRDAIHADVMANGWSDQRQSFVQRYGAEALDASLLLIPVMGFLPIDHPRTRKTVDRIAEHLGIDGLIYRFDPLETPVDDPRPVGAFEGSFLPCTFWLATAYALAGQTNKADATLRRAESLTQEIGLFAEEADARNDEMLGNYPLLFSQVEYVRAVLALRQASMP